MIYIKLDDDKSLVITVYEPIYRGDNLSEKITFLIPFEVGEVDMLKATPYLSYIRADGVADIVRLDRESATYKGSYYQYTLPVSCRLSKCSGEVCAWLQIFSGTPSSPTIAKSGECLLYVEDSKNMDDYLCDHQISAIYALQKEAEASSETVARQFDDVKAELETKGDSLFYDEEKNILQLKSGDNPVGDAIDVKKVADSDDETIYFSGIDGSDESGGSESGGSGSGGSGSSDDTDDVIRFD